MYCSTCGTAVIEGLNYCKSCGARVGSANANAAGNLSEASINTLLGGIIALPIGGIGIIIGLLVVMKKELDLVDPMIVTITLLSFTMLMVAEIALIWLLVRHTKATKEPGSAVNFKDVVLKNLNGAQTRGLAEGTHEPIPSIIENTTRNLEPVYRESKTR